MNLGDVIGTRTVVEIEKREMSGRVQTCCLMRCTCGRECWQVAANVPKTMRCQSCANTISSTTHGLTRTPLHRRYNSMRQRCLNPNSTRYADYGGRGIAICPRWSGRDGFANFAADMGEPPTPEHTIERVDNSTGYSPENCRWATAAEQSRNTRRNRWLIVHGEKICIEDAARIVGMHPRTLWGRLANDWEPGAALFGNRTLAPPRKNSIWIVVDEKPVLLKDAARDAGVPYQRLRDRMTKFGMSYEEAIADRDYNEVRRKAHRQKPRTNARWVEINGQQVPLAVASRETGLSVTVLLYRAAKGWPPETMLQPSRRRSDVVNGERVQSAVAEYVEDVDLAA